MTTYVGVGRVLVHWPVEVDIFFVGDHVVAEARQGHLIHDVQYEAFDRDVHILREVHLVQFVKDLFEAVEEGVAGQDANSFLGPDLVVVFEFRVFQFSLQAARAILVKEKNCSVVAFTLGLGEDEVERLRVLVLSVQLDAHWKDKVRDVLLEWLVFAVLRWVPIQNFGGEPSLEQVNFHEGEEAVFPLAEAVRHDFDPLDHLVGLELIVTLALDHVDVVDGRLEFFLPLDGQAEGFVRGGGTRETVLRVV